MSGIEYPPTIEARMLQQLERIGDTLERMEKRAATKAAPSPTPQQTAKTERERVVDTYKRSSRKD